MKASAKRLARDEQGRVMMLVLVLLVVGGLMLAPLLGLMSTGLTAGQVYENSTDGLYAADAGVEDALWKIDNQVEQVKYLYCPGGNHSWSYPEPGDPQFEINGKSVEVTITYVNNTTYQVISTATGNRGATQIEAYVTCTASDYDFSGMLEHIAISQNETDIKKKVTLVYPEGAGVVENYTGDWPTGELLGGYYWEDVENVTEWGSGTIELNGNNMDLGPLYRDGSLEILNSSSTPATLTLTGTIYITGDTLIGQNGKDTVTLDLNGNTIFVSSNTSGSQKALIIGGKCTIMGPGAIISVGDFYFAPKAQAGGEEESIFALSVSGTTSMQPSGTFYGALAGSVEVEVKQGTNPIITYPQGGFGGLLGFPTFLEAGRLCSIVTWEITPL
jgi:hypothetical protein